MKDAIEDQRFKENDDWLTKTKQQMMEDKKEAARTFGDNIEDRITTKARELGLMNGASQIEKMIDLWHAFEINPSLWNLAIVNECLYVQFKGKSASESTIVQTFLKSKGIAYGKASRRSPNEKGCFEHIFTRVLNQRRRGIKIKMQSRFGYSLTPKMKKGQRQVSHCPFPLELPCFDVGYIDVGNRDVCLAQVLKVRFGYDIPGHVPRRLQCPGDKTVNVSMLTDDFSVKGNEHNNSGPGMATFDEWPTMEGQAGVACENGDGVVASSNETKAKVAANDSFELFGNEPFANIAESQPVQNVLACNAIDPLIVDHSTQQAVVFPSGNQSPEARQATCIARAAATSIVADQMLCVGGCNDFAPCNVRCSKCKGHIHKTCTKLVQAKFGEDPVRMCPNCAKTVTFRRGLQGLANIVVSTFVVQLYF